MCCKKDQQRDLCIPNLKKLRSYTDTKMFIFTSAKGLLTFKTTEQQQAAASKNKNPFTH